MRSAAYANMKKPLTSAERGLLTWVHGTGCGGFQQSLWKTLQLADNGNLHALAKGFPEEVACLVKYRTEPGYHESLLARKD